MAFSVHKYRLKLIPNIYVRVFICFLGSVLSTGLLNSFPSIEPVLIQHGYFNSECHGKSTCFNQKLQLSSLYNIGGGVSVGLFSLYGIIYDHFGPNKTACLGALGCMVSFVMCAFSTIKSLEWLLYPGITLADSFGNLSCLGLIGFMWHFPRHQAVLSGIWMTSGSLSTSFGLLFPVLYQSGTSLYGIFLFFAALCLLSFVFVWVSTPDLEEYLEYVQKNIVPEDIDDGASQRLLPDDFNESFPHETMNGSINGTIDENMNENIVDPTNELEKSTKSRLLLNSSINSSNDSPNSKSTDTNQQIIPLRTLLSEFWAMYKLFYTSNNFLIVGCMLGGIFLNAVTADLYPYLLLILTKSDALLISDAFSIVYAIFGSIGGPLTGILVDRYGLPNNWVACTFVLIICVIFIFIPFPGFIWLWTISASIYLVYINNLSTKYCMVFSTPQMVGTFIGFSLSVQGICQIVLNYPMNSIMLATDLDKYWVIVVPFLLFGGLAVLISVIYSYYFLNHVIVPTTPLKRSDYLKTMK